MPRNPVICGLLIGPLVGAVAAWLVLTAYSLIWPAYPNSVQFLGWISLLVIAIPVGYMFGLVPSLIAGVINAGFAQSALSLTGRVIVAVPVGILTTWLVWFWMILGMPSYNVGIYAAMFTAAGAFGCPAAVWWASRPRRAKASAGVSRVTARNVWLVLTALFVGPLIGAAVFIAFAFVTDGLTAKTTAPPTTNFFTDYWPIILTAAYVLGFIPAVLSAITVAIIAPRFGHLWQRLIAAALVGAAISAIGIGLFIFADDAGSVDDVIIIGGVALTGAVSAVLCLFIVELFHPLPKPPAAPTA